MGIVTSNSACPLTSKGRCGNHVYHLSHHISIRSTEIGAKPLTVILIMTTPNFLFYGLSFANIDWMVVLGLIMPPQIGLFLVLAKPQIGMGVAFYWAYEAYQKGGGKTVLRTFTPVTLALLISILLYGLWPFRPQNWAANTSLWPESIPIGLALLTASFRNRQKGLALVSSPFLSPYVGVQSWSVAVLGLLPRQIETIIVGMWVVNLIENERMRMWLFGMG